MKRIFLILLCILLFGCDGSTKVGTDAFIIKRNGMVKSHVPEQFWNNGLITPIKMNDEQDFYTVNEWYDDHSIIYTVGEDAKATMYIHNIYTGEQRLFYQTDEFIVKIIANPSHTLFALQTLKKSGETHFIILNRMGMEVFSMSKKMEDLQFMWNPYVEDELIATEFKTLLEFQIYEIKVGSKKMTPIAVHNPYVQWISEKELGYLNWDQSEPDLEAPLFLYNVTTKKETEWLQDRILLFSLKNIIITVSIDTNDLSKCLYSFYHPQTKENIANLYIPVLNTFSESWWIPSHDYDATRQLYYYLAPKRAGDITEYDEGFDLSVFSLVDQKEQVLLTVNNNLPIKLSPDGNWCLMGQQLEQIIHLPSGQLLEVVPNQ